MKKIILKICYIITVFYIYFTFPIRVFATNTYICQTDDPPIKFLYQTPPPGLMNPGQTTNTSLTLVNCSGNTLGKSSFKLGSQNPQDNTTWGQNRIDLPEDVPTGRQLTISFPITAPPTNGSYVFQWAIVSNSGQWYIPYSPPALVTLGQGGKCPQAETLRNTGQDSAGAIQNCIDNSEGKILELPAGTYSVSHGINISRSIILRTTGTAGNTKMCLAAGAPECARIQALPNYKNTSSDLNVWEGIISISWTNGTTLDHIVVDGNKANRSPSYEFCTSNWNYLILEGASTAAKYFYSASINSPCQHSFRPNGTNGTIAYNLIADNGTHTGHGAWSDGMGPYGIENTIIMYNIFRDNTDINLVLFGAKYAKIWNNTFTHTNSSSVNNSFGALGVDDFGNESISDYTGTDISYNLINCNYKCTFGIVFPEHIWDYGTLSVFTKGGHIHHNIIRRARQGIAIDGAGTVNQPLVLGNNTIVDSGGFQPNGCSWQSNGINIAPDSKVQFERNVPIDSTNNTHPADGYVQCWFNLSNSTLNVPSCTAPVQPANLSPNGSVSSTATLQWNNDNNASRFAIRINDLSDPSFNSDCDHPYSGDICDNNVYTNSYTFTSQPGHSYDWWIYSLNYCDQWSQASFAHIETTPLPGDLNHDGRVDILDFRRLLGSFTNIFDYNLVVGSFGR